MTTNTQPRLVRRRIFTHSKPTAPRKRTAVELFAEVASFDADARAWLRRQRSLSAGWTRCRSGAMMAAVLRELGNTDHHKAAEAALGILGLLSDALTDQSHVGHAAAMADALDGGTWNWSSHTVRALLTEAGEAPLSSRFAIAALGYALQVLDSDDPGSTLAMVAHLAELHGTVTRDRGMAGRVADLMRQSWPTLDVDARIATLAAAARKLAIETEVETTFERRLRDYARLVGVHLETVAAIMPSWRIVDGSGATLGAVVLGDARALVEAA